MENRLSTSEALEHLCKVPVVLLRCCLNVSYISSKCLPDVEIPETLWKGEEKQHELTLGSL